MSEDQADIIRRSIRHQLAEEIVTALTTAREGWLSRHIWETYAAGRRDSYTEALDIVRRIGGLDAAADRVRAVSVRDACDGMRSKSG